MSWVSLVWACSEGQGCPHSLTGTVLHMALAGRSGEAGGARGDLLGPPRQRLGPGCRASKARTADSAAPRVCTAQEDAPSKHAERRGQVSDERGGRTPHRLERTEAQQDAELLSSGSLKGTKKAGWASRAQRRKEGSMKDQDRSCDSP